MKKKNNLNGITHGLVASPNPAENAKIVDINSELLSKFIIQKIAKGMKFLAVPSIGNSEE